MSDKKDIKRILADFSGGFSTGTGLRLWLFFLFCFFFLGYPVPLSILLGAAGGIAGGWVFGWWQTKDQLIEVTPEEIEATEASPDAPPRVSGLRLAKQRREARAKQRPSGLVTPLSGFFEKRNKLSRKSRAGVASSDDE
ncbi:MAG TPA: hypothetical protein V6C95_17750 [Coleofasciculaceae cyanobacterium]